MKAASPQTATPRPAAGRRGGALKRTGVKTLDLYEQLRQMAISFRMRPGERINEVELSAAFGVSRSNVREALNRLVAEHFLTFVPNRGFFGRAFERRDIFNLYELRKYVESAALDLALVRARDLDIKALKAFWNDALKKARLLPDDELLRLDEEMHLRLAALSGNEELVRTLEGINARIHFVRWLQMQARREATFDEHRDLLDALGRRDGPRAQAILQAHISRRMEEISEIVEAGVIHLYAK